MSSFFPPWREGELERKPGQGLVVYSLISLPFLVLGQYFRRPLGSCPIVRLETGPRGGEALLIKKEFRKHLTRMRCYWILNLTGTWIAAWTDVSNDCASFSVHWHFVVNQFTVAKCVHLVGSFIGGARQVLSPLSSKSFACKQKNVILKDCTEYSKRTLDLKSSKQEWGVFGLLPVFWIWPQRFQDFYLQPLRQIEVCSVLRNVNALRGWSDTNLFWAEIEATDSKRGDLEFCVQRVAYVRTRPWLKLITPFLYGFRSTRHGAFMRKDEWRRKMENRKWPIFILRSDVFRLRRPNGRLVEGGQGSWSAEDPGEKSRIRRK